MQHIHRFIRSLITQLPPHGRLGEAVTQKRVPPVLPFTKSSRHFAALHSAGEETRCHFSCQRWFSAMGGISYVQKWMLRSSQIHKHML